VSRGGRRDGAGRKPRKDAVVTSSISMRPEEWRALDVLRGDLSRSEWLRKKVADASRRRWGER
jgi:hypothetical protein